MALPFDLSALATALDNFTRGGPFISSTGNVYAVLIDAGDTTKLTAIKASDPSASWSAKDGAHAPVANALGYCLHAYQALDVLHVVTETFDGSQYHVQYHTFDMSTDLWGITAETVVDMAGDSSGPQYVGAWVGVRSNGDVIVVYNAESELISGTYYPRVKYARRVSGSWTTNVVVAKAGTDHFWVAQGLIMGSSDRAHFIFTDATDSTLVYERTLLSDNSLETFPGSSIIDLGFTPTAFPGGHGTSYVSGGVTKIRMPFDDTNDSDNIHIVKFDSADVPSPSSETATTSAIHTVFSFQLPQALAAFGTTLHLLFAVISTQKIRHTSSANGAAWAAEDAENNAAAHSIMANAYTRASHGRLAYIYFSDDDGKTYYNERDLGVQTLTRACNIPAEWTGQATTWRRLIPVEWRGFLLRRDLIPAEWRGPHVSRTFPLLVEWSGTGEELTLSWNVLQGANFPLLIEWSVLSPRLESALSITWDIVDSKSQLPLRWRVVPEDMLTAFGVRRDGVAL
jgi:hypothetical protein